MKRPLSTIRPFAGERLQLDQAAIASGIGGPAGLARPRIHGDEADSPSVSILADRIATLFKLLARIEWKERIHAKLARIFLAVNAWTRDRGRTGHDARSEVTV